MYKGFTKNKTMILLTILLLLSVPAAVALILLIHPAFGRRPNAGRQARILASPNYRDGQFQNQIPTPQFTGSKNAVLPTLWRMLSGRQGKVERVPLAPLPAVKTDLKALSPDTDLVVWFGHSSYLLHIGGKRILVDPVLELEFPVNLMMRPFPGTDIYHAHDMPDIDYLVITHEHWDHLDYATLRKMRHKVKHVLCPLGVAEYLEYWHYSPDIITETDWHDTYSDGNITFICLPTRHFSNRLFRRNQTLWASYLVQADGKQVYLGGDGGYDERFLYIRKTYGHVDLAMMENGQYNDNWAYIHMRPADLEKAIIDLQAKQVFTVHHDKFALAPHDWDEPHRVARNIAEHNSIHLLDQPIGKVTKY